MIISSLFGVIVWQKMVSAPAPMIDTSDMDPELARYLNRNYWQQKSVELKSSSSSATATQPSAPVIAADTKMSTAGGGGMNNSSTLQPQNTARDDEVTSVAMLYTVWLSRFRWNLASGAVLACSCVRKKIDPLDSCTALQQAKNSKMSTTCQTIIIIVNNKQCAGCDTQHAAQGDL